jgi:GH35 family endo-1,4-beta-xylanase
MRGLFVFLFLISTKTYSSEGVVFLIQKYTDELSARDLLNKYVLVNEKEENYRDSEFGVSCKLNYFKDSNLAKTECIDEKSKNIYEAYNIEGNEAYENSLFRIRKNNRKLVIKTMQKGFKIPSKSEEKKIRKELDGKINAIIDRQN